MCAESHVSILCGKQALCCKGEEIRCAAPIVARSLYQTRTRRGDNAAIESRVFVVSKKPKKFIAVCDLRDYDTQN